MQGFNQGRYVPPEHEGVRTGNALHRRRAPGTLRPDGTQTVRFELPFGIWCGGCAAASAQQHPTLIAQGVRFNARKRRVGTYHSTPIWSFTFAHPACGGEIEVRTDPAGTRYVVVTGGTARAEAREEEEGEEEREVLTPEERERRREDAFAALEGGVVDRASARARGKRVQELYEAAERDGRDPWTANRRVREEFRRERKVRAREARAMEALQERLGTEMEIVPLAEADAERAALVVFGTGELEEEQQERRATREGNGFAALSSKARARSTMASGGDGDPRSRAEMLRRRLVSNTRAARNPFG